MRSLRITAVLLALSAPAATLAQEKSAPAPTTVGLPAAKLDGKVSLEKALKERRSVRALSTKAISLEELGQLCWAAQGVTDDKGHRTAPSARAKYPLELYVLAGDVPGLAAGLYRYLPEKHALVLVAAGDKRAEFVEKAIGQTWILKAPAVLVVAGAVERMGDMKERGAQFMWTEAGLAAQGFFLQATALGLGSTYVGGFKPEPARAVLALPAGEEVLAVLPVGRRQ